MPPAATSIQGGSKPTLESGWTHLAMARVQAAVPTQSDTMLVARRTRACEPASCRSTRVMRGRWRCTATWSSSSHGSAAASDPAGSGLLEEAERDLRAATTTRPEARARLGRARLHPAGPGKIRGGPGRRTTNGGGRPLPLERCSVSLHLGLLALELHHVARADSLFARGEALYPREAAFVSNRLVIVASQLDPPRLGRYGVGSTAQDESPPSCGPAIPGGPFPGGRDSGQGRTAR